MIVKRVPYDQWRAVQTAAHEVVFKELIASDDHRFDFTIVVEDDDGAPLAYVSARELSSTMLYLIYGGAFPSARGTRKSWDAHAAMIDWTRQAGYHGLSSLVDSENVKYLGMAMHDGFRVRGVRVWDDGSVLCEMRLKLR